MKKPIKEQIKAAQRFIRNIEQGGAKKLAKVRPATWLKYSQCMGEIQKQQPDTAMALQQRMVLAYREHDIDQ